MGSSKERGIKPASIRSRSRNKGAAGGGSDTPGKVISRHIWKNGMMIVSRFYEDQLTSEPSDCISLEIHPAPGHGSPAMFYLNVEDAVAIIQALSNAVGAAIEKRKPIWPEK